MNNQFLKLALLCTGLVALSGCTNMSLFKDTTPIDQTAIDTLPPGPIEPIAPALIPAATIKNLLIGKSWRWQGPNNGGVTLFAADGTSLVEVNGKGTTQGKWVVRDGQLCESFGPAKFIPNGKPMKCQPFVGSDGQYRVGQANFSLAG